MDFQNHLNNAESGLPFVLLTSWGIHLNLPINAVRENENPFSPLLLLQPVPVFFLRCHETSLSSLKRPVFPPLYMYWCFPSDKLCRINRIPFHGTLIPGSCLPFFRSRGAFSLYLVLLVCQMIGGKRTFRVLEKRRCIREAFMEIFSSRFFFDSIS